MRRIDRAAGTTPQTIAGEPIRRFVLLSLGFLALALTLVCIAVVRGPALSPVDEPTHADYAYQISHGTIPAKGSLISSEIQYEGACHTLKATSSHADCSTAAATFAPEAQNYNFGEAPLYYLITGEMDRGLDAVFPGTHDFITLGRTIGAGWLFSGMLVLYLALRRFGVEWPFAAAAATLLPLCPGVLAASSTMTNDAPAALAGATALYMLARVTTQERTGWLLPAAATALATATKVLNGMPMLAVACVAGFLAVARWRRGAKSEAYSAAACCLGILVAFGVVYLGWDLFQAGRGEVGWVNPNSADAVPLSGSPAGDLLSNLFGSFQHLTTNYWLQPGINGETVTIWATLLGVLFAAAPLLVLTAGAARSSSWMLGLATLGGVTAVPLAVELQVYMQNHAYFAEVTGRYALSFIPWVIACLAIVLSRRHLLKTSNALVGVGMGVMLLAETGLFTLGPALVDHASFLVG